MSSGLRDRAELLAARRESLVALAQVQRNIVAIHWRELDAPLRWVERGWQAWAFARARPWAVLLPVAALLMWRPHWLGRAATAFVAVSRARRWLR